MEKISGLWTQVRLSSSWFTCLTKSRKERVPFFWQGYTIDCTVLYNLHCGLWNTVHGFVLNYFKDRDTRHKTFIQTDTDNVNHANLQQSVIYDKKRKPISYIFNHYFACMRRALWLDTKRQTTSKRIQRVANGNEDTQRLSWTIIPGKS